MKGVETVPTPDGTAKMRAPRSLRRWSPPVRRPGFARSPVFVAVAALVLAGCTGGEPGAPRPIEIKFGHVGSPGSLFALSAEEFAHRANERLGERGQVVVFGASQLGSDEVMLQKLKLGTLELALPSTIMSTTVEEFGLFEMPYLVEDREHMKRIEEEILWPELAPLAEERGYTILAVWENGFRHVTNNVRPIVAPSDLRGIKLRTPRGTWRVRLFQEYGANPTPMALSEVFVALQTGVMDGQENPFAQIWASKFQEVQEYLSLTSHVYSPAYVTTGTRAWNRLPEDVRVILLDTARETRDFVYSTAEQMDADLLRELAAAGLQVNEADRDAFVEASRAIYEAFGTEVPGGAELVRRAMALSER